MAKHTICVVSRVELGALELREGVWWEEGGGGYLGVVGHEALLGVGVGEANTGGRLQEHDSCVLRPAGANQRREEEEEAKGKGNGRTRVSQVWRGKQGEKQGEKQREKQGEKQGEKQEGAQQQTGVG